MQQLAPKTRLIRLVRILPWLHFLAAVLVFILTALYSTVDSELGRAISAGESPFFAWICSHLPVLFAVGPVFF